ncbi:Protein-glutamate methylesterase/protein-glutamine glutaminase [Pseudoalteromonas sp. CIP111854]|uniref:Protein-glutamate methylesterase/protein-glutamine glutaminase n=1 Tax=Pseudoalteromonas holothuriae TaxID=2963714 RepID=A0A9W4W171_9GAMM|nr:response regulator [Pseudoalteromonas sp. CIP111854]CAH9051418.1 Protein-glutamate methylesterase/protein-glutamine glutaminase [Pseudoalteromonas sp. CIP111854]
MSTLVLICDDSKLARRQLARSLPNDWDIKVEFAEHGIDCLEKIKQFSPEILFLDLNMPQMDGYGVLEAIRDQDLNVLTVVVSGDIQPNAHQRVIELGAIDFIRKPCDANKLIEIIEHHGIRDRSIRESLVHKLGEQLEPEIRDIYQELTNVAMGQAGDLLARLLNVFVELPIPNVNVLEVSELHMALQAIDASASTSGVCQGFIGGGVSGEALLLLNDSSFKEVASLMNYHGELTDKVELELLMDISNILIGAILTGLSKQLDMPFSQGHPVVLGQHCDVSDLVKANKNRWKRTLAIEISYGIENHNINCDLMLLFTEDSLKTLKYKVAYLLED